MNSKKIFFLASLLIALISCGGGGGGGGGSSSGPTSVGGGTGTTTPTNSSTYDSSGNVRWRDTTRTYNSNDPHNKNSVTLTGNSVSVGVIDTAFNTTNSTLRSDMTSKFGTRLININTVNRSEAGDYHGIMVAENIGGNTSNGVAKGVTLVVADATEYDGSDAYLDPTVTMYSTMYNTHGVRIFNQSFGSEKAVTYYNNNPSSLYYYVNPIGTSIYNFYKTAVSNGALFVWSAGNDENASQPSIEGGLPYFDSSLQQGWINVVALSTKYNSTLGNISWNNLQPLSPAGVAANWSVTAIGDYIYSVNGSNIAAGGSSFAAPIVTGTAALIKQKYPWMTGSLIRQTILSTATDIGAEGVDSVFGWGLLNIGKAVNGPSLFSTALALGNRVTLDVTSGTYTFSNDISGDAGVIKNGPGTLILSGRSTYTGATTVNAGRLQVNGTYASAVSISPLGTFTTAENANLSSDVSNDGTFENTSRTATIEGNYSATSSSKFLSSLGSSINISGNVDLNDSTLELTNEVDGEASYVTAKGVTSDVITSDNAINGSFSKVETPELLNADIISTSDTVNAKLSRKNVLDYITTSELSDSMRDNVAQNLETAFSALDNQLEEGTAGDVSSFAKSAAQLQTMTLPNASAVLDSLSGQIYGSAQALTFQHSQTVNKDLSNRLTMLGTLDNVGDKAGFWLSGITANGKLREDGFGEGKTKVNGGQIGIDKSFTDNLILGAAFSYSKSDVNFNRYGGESEATNLGISVYGRWDNRNNPLYIQGRLGAGFVSTDVERDIILSSSNISRAKIEHDDKVYSGYLETGWDIQNGNFTFTPFVGISHDTVRRGAFSETNSQFGLTADKKTYSQTNGLMGLRLGQSFNWGNGSKTTLQGYVTHQRAFNDEDLSFEAAYTGLSNASFTVKGIGLARNRTWAGIGVLTEFNPNFAWYANYDGKIEKGKLNNNVFTTGIRINID